jgi:hypothetical protein
MPIAEVQFYDVVVWLHVSAVVVGFGGTFAYGVFIAIAARDAPRSLPGVFAGMAANDRILVTGGGLLILITGIYLAADRWDFSEFFISWGILAWLILIALVHRFFIPNERKAAAAAERDIERAGSGEVEFGPEFNEANGKLAKMGPVAGLIIVLTVYVMVAKPFL